MCDYSKGCCGNCRYVIYDKKQGYVCVNTESEYCADYTEHDFVCEDYVSKNDAE